MAQSLAKVCVHLVFSTKDRRPFLSDPTMRDELHRYLGGACNGHDSQPVIVGGVADHVHILCSLSRGISISDLVRELKKQSTRWIKSGRPVSRDFHWQNGFGAFSVSPSHVSSVRSYIKAQEEHHRKETFQDEFRRLLGKYGVSYDEKYVWD